MGMLVVIVVRMQMFVLDGFVYMLQLNGICARPENESSGRRDESDHGQHNERDRKTERAADPSGQRVRDQPTAMGQGQLGFRNCTVPVPECLTHLGHTHFTRDSS